MRFRPEIILPAVAVSVFLTGCAPRPGTTRESHTIEVEGETFRVTFDPGLLSWRELRADLKLAPRFWFTLASPVSLNVCNSEGTHYRQPCGSHDPAARHFLDNARVNLYDARLRLRQLSRHKVDPDLKPVHDYVLKEQALWNWLAETELHYYQSWDDGILAKPPPGDQDLPPCASPILEQLRLSPNWEMKYRVASHDWHNCMNGRLEQIAGTYPLSTWQRFLRDRQIRIRFTGLD